MTWEDHSADPHVTTQQDLTLEIARLKKQNELMRQGLQYIQQPTKYYNDYMCRTGDNLNGMAVVSAINNPQTYKDIATETLKLCEAVK